MGLDLHSFAHATSPKIEKQRTRSRTSTTAPADLCTEDNDDISESAIMRKYFVDFAKNKLNVPLNDLEITTIHDLPKWKDGTQPVIVQLLSPDKKSALMRKRAMLQGSKVYLNDHLSQTNGELFREATRLTKDNKIFSVWTLNCKVFIKKSEHAQRLHVVNVQQLRDIVR